jgi:hypothetical protein
MSSYSIDDIMFTLKKLDISFTRVQIWKQYNKFCEVNTTNMVVEEFASTRGPKTY